MSKSKKQDGFLLISAIILIVVVGFLAVTVSYISTSGSLATADQIDSGSAFYIAQAGLARATQQLSTGTIACADITDNDDFTNVAFGKGEFTVTATHFQPTAVSLGVAISSNASVIPVISLTGYSSSGRVIIGNEAINYTGTSTSAAVCGAAFCLTGATRGVAGTTAASHSVGAIVSQNQCNLVSTGAVPNLSNPTGERQLTNQVALGTTGGNGNAWTVGDDRENSEVIGFWNGTSWEHQGPYAGVPNVDLNGIDMINASDGWAVGDRTGGDGLFVRWNGSAWSQVTPATNVPNRNVNDVSCNSTNDCWAVGDDANGRANFIRWNGSTWSRAIGSQLNANVPNVDIDGVDCIDGNDCWAVGQDQGGDATFVHWNGSQWSRSTGSAVNANVPNQDLNDVSCVDGNDCWAVGRDQGGDATLVHWNGSQWSRATGFQLNGNVPNVDLNDVYCIAGNDCWAVGQRSFFATFLRWNGVQWSRIFSTTVNSRNLFGVSCDTSSDCWAVGQRRTIAHWNGVNWTGVDAPALPNNAPLRAVDIVGGGSTGVGLDQREIIWNEDFQ